MKKIPAFAERAGRAKLIGTTAIEHYGRTYEDMNNRVPSVEKIWRLLGWKPSTPMRDMLRMTAEWYAENPA